MKKDESTICIVLSFQSKYVYNLHTPPSPPILPPGLLLVFDSCSIVQAFVYIFMFNIFIDTADIIVQFFVVVVAVFLFSVLHNI